jgi:hypothetical protein
VKLVIKFDQAAMCHHSLDIRRVFSRYWFMVLDMYSGKNVPQQSSDESHTGHLAWFSENENQASHLAPELTSPENKNAIELLIKSIRCVNTVLKTPDGAHWYSHWKVVLALAAQLLEAVQLFGAEVLQRLQSQASRK